jgi:Fe-S cluster biosynthesis and repair protein YggX
MSNMEKAKADAEVKAQIDFAKGLEYDPGRHQARGESAWATWYFKEYLKLKNEEYLKEVNQKHKKEFENILKRFA